jgi:NifB/MoaA-like Fe-S oxidoreductase
VTGSDELYLLAERPLPGPDHYGEFSQIENGVGAVAWLRKRVREGLPSVRKFDGARVGVVTGTAMAPLLPELLDELAARTGARFELFRTVNSLFGPTISTAGLLVGADIERTLGDRRDLDFALFPAETLNDASRFLDDRTLDDVRAAVPVPLIPSYDFIDALSAESVTAGQL